MLFLFSRHKYTNKNYREKLFPIFFGPNIGFMALLLQKALQIPSTKDFPETTLHDISYKDITTKKHFKKNYFTAERRRAKQEGYNHEDI